MSTQLRNDDEWDPQEAAAAEEVLKLEAEVQQMAEKLLEYRATLPDQLHSTLSSLLASQRPVSLARLSVEESGPEAGTPPRPEAEAGATQGLERTVEVEKIQLLKQKMSGNALTLPVVLKRMEVYMGTIEELASSDGVIHPAFKRNELSESFWCSILCFVLYSARVLSQCMLICEKERIMQCDIGVHHDACLPIRLLKTCIIGR
ncbi:hypothetical protein Sango_0211600 [Sesamum angolense]|uniref:Uncharacterized protein n=1 Tax=Sesamum angolense TaxID=2727404 RepID=A0AAE1XGA4_9LAMI|nr:hypothetical protein Sango_0211600 [Sesamum angolense]